jgi:hypothetical protein
MRSLRGRVLGRVLALRLAGRWAGLIGPVFGIGVVAFGSGCGREAIATTDALPVARVVVYRNGVAYFERAGHVDENEVRFRMKPSEVGDFLATLAVMERGGSSVRAAAFPLKSDADTDKDKAASDDSDDDDRADDTADTDRRYRHRRPPPPKDPGDKKKKDGLETVVLSLDGKSHELQVGYVAESPVWRPSYRLVVHDKGDADLQVWGIVQNLSGEDWKDVKLSLIAGAPLAFQAELGTPVIPPRPTVTDEGEVIAAVPRAETTLNQDQLPATPAAAPAPPPPPPEAEPVLEDAPSPSGAASGAGRLMDAKKAMAPRAAAMNAPSPVPRPQRVTEASVVGGMPGGAPSKPRNLASLAAVAAEGGSTRYDLPLPVTIPDKSATMVMLLSRSVSGEALFLFAPDGNVPDSASHPFRVARFTNSAGGTLERGPIAVFEGGAFLGQGMVDPLPNGATATVPFALERGIAIDEDRKYDEQGARLAKIENGVITVERDRVTQTRYRVRNGGEQVAKLLVKHPRIGGARLFNPPAGTEDNVGTGSALVPLTVPPHATPELVVDERATQWEEASWFTDIADAAVKAFIADPKSDKALAQKLGVAWVIQAQIVAKNNDRAQQAQMSSTLSESTEETRRNLKAIEKNKTAEALRQKLTARLTDTSAKLDDVNRKLVELDSKLSEMNVQFKEAVRDITFAVAPDTVP